MTNALIVVDVQNDFADPEGSLYVQGGENIAVAIRKFIDDHQGTYDAVVATKDWHPEHFGQFAHFSNHPDYVKTWPPHCVSWTWGAQFHPRLVDETQQEAPPFDATFFKGQDAAAYSGFEGVIIRLPMRDGQPILEAFIMDKVGLDTYLKEFDIDEVDIVGLATDYCVKATALDAVRNGYTTNVIINLCAGVHDDSTDKAIHDMTLEGVNFNEA